MTETKLCIKCSETKPTTEFYLKRGKPNSYCKSCSKAIDAIRVAEHRRNIKKTLVEEAGGKCVDCGLIGPPFMYDFDHREPNDKAFSISASTVLGIDALREEAKKCDLVCGNCHRWRTHRQRCDGCDYC